MVEGHAQQSKASDPFAACADAEHESSPGVTAGTPGNGSLPRLQGQEVAATTLGEALVDAVDDSMALLPLTKSQITSRNSSKNVNAATLTE